MDVDAAMCIQYGLFQDLSEKPVKGARLRVLTRGALMNSDFETSQEMEHRAQIEGEVDREYAEEFAGRTHEHVYAWIAIAVVIVLAGGSLVWIPDRFVNIRQLLTVIAMFMSFILVCGYFIKREMLKRICFSVLNEFVVTPCMRIRLGRAEPEHWPKGLKDEGMEIHQRKQALIKDAWRMINDFRLPWSTVTCGGTKRHLKRFFQSKDILDLNNRVSVYKAELEKWQREVENLL